MAGDDGTGRTDATHRIGQHSAPGVTGRRGTGSKLPGSCARRYEPIELLASGGFGDVVLARQVELDRRVVVKVLHAHALSDPAEVARFVNNFVTRSVTAIGPATRVITASAQTGTAAPPA